MNVDLTGRENIMLRGLYNGLKRPAIRRLEEDVAAFAELGEFLDLPVRVYSSGMVVRLGFALATAIRPQVLLMDEWFLAGDAEFMERARVRLEDMVRGADILVLSTHVDRGGAELVHPGDLARPGAGAPTGRPNRCWGPISATRSAGPLLSFSERQHEIGGDGEAAAVLAVVERVRPGQRAVVAQLGADQQAADRLGQRWVSRWRRR